MFESSVLGVYYLKVNFIKKKKFKPQYIRLNQTFQENKEQSSRNLLRFIDDCFIIFTRTEEQLMKFFNLYHSFHPSIKFTLNKNRTHFPF